MINQQVKLVIFLIFKYFLNILNVLQVIILKSICIYNRNTLNGIISNFYFKYAFNKYIVINI